MLRIKNTIACPGCQGILRVRVNVVSDGRDYEYYLCPRCEDVARLEPSSGEWILRAAPSPGIGDVVQTLQALAVEEWRSKSSTRPPNTFTVSSPESGRR
jgi:hypothetical protein